MLNKLHIQNIALIDECSITFDNGFNVLSGETGAGKSIIIDALNFLLGAKADKTLVKSGESFAKVEGWFKINSELSFYDTMFDLISQPKDDVLFLSRSYVVNGKTECKINGESYPLNILKKVGEFLVDIFGQNDHSFLLDTNKHIQYLDFMSKKIASLKEILSTHLLQLKDINNNISQLGGSGEERERNIEILQYQINEIESANLAADEEDKLLEKKTLLLNSEKIANNINQITEISNNSNISGSLKTISNLICELTNYFPSFSDFSERINSAKYEIDDVLTEIFSATSDMEYNENELNFIEERLDYINDLKRKYGKNINDIKQQLVVLKNKLEQMYNITEVLSELNAKKQGVLKNIFEVCNQITFERELCAKELEAGLVLQLKQLGMKNSTFKVNFNNTYTLNNIEHIVTQNGCDNVEFLFSANLGEPVKSLSKIISGGEMSRVMLAFKCILNNSLQKTYVFDEIDTGIGGAVGSVVAKKLSEISRNNQVLCVTHLAQIACFSDVSYKIEKYEQNNKTFSKINPLSEDDKVKEITRMIGVGENTQFATLHAKELIKEALAFKKEIITN